MARSPARTALRIGCTALRIGRSAVAAAALAVATWPLAPAEAAWPFGPSAPPGPTHEIKAPYYGDALFYFFQDRYFTSITTMMASQQFDRLTKHDDEAEILRGGMLASYGQTKEAGEIFATMVARGASQSTRELRGAVLGGQIVQHIGGDREAGGVPA